MSWTKNASAKSYTVQISNKKGKFSGKNLIDTKTTTKTKVTFSKKLTKGKTYYVRISANGGTKYAKGFSTYGTAKSVKCK